MALGKWQKTLGKPFPECHTRQSRDGKKVDGKVGFAECLLSSTWQSPRLTLVKQKYAS